MPLLFLVEDRSVPLAPVRPLPPRLALLFALSLSVRFSFHVVLFLAWFVGHVSSFFSVPVALSFYREYLHHHRHQRLHSGVNRGVVRPRAPRPQIRRLTPARNRNPGAASKSAKWRQVGRPSG